MIQIDLKVINAPQMVCFERAISTIASTMSRRYEMAFSKSLSVSFQIKDYTSSCSADMIIIDNWDTIELMEAFHGIKLIDTVISNFNEIDNIINNKIPIFVVLKNSFVPWAKDKSDTDRTFLVLSYIDNKSIYCHDTYSGINGFIDLNSFFSGLDVIKIPRLIDTDTKTTDCIKFISDYLHKIKRDDTKGENLYYGMNCFANFIENIYEPDIEFNTHKCYDGFILKLIDLSRGRGLFSLTLQYLAELMDNKEILRLSNQLQQVSIKWASIRGLIHTYSCAHAFNNTKRVRISRMIRENSLLEESIVDELILLLK